MDPITLDTSITLASPQQAVLSPQQAITRASEVAALIADAIKQRGWSLTIEGREYVRVEGWQLLATLLGCTPYITQVWREDRDDGYVYVARCEIRRLSDGQAVASGEGLCASNETLRKRDGTIVARWHDEYAVRAMAQTRAVGRAMRNAYGGIIAMAGYAPTPAEEMVEEVVAHSDAAPPTSPPAPPLTTSPPKRVTQKADSVHDARDAKIKSIFAAMRDAGLDASDRVLRLKIAREALGKDVESYRTLTADEAETVAAYVRTLRKQQHTTGDDFPPPPKTAPQQQQQPPQPPPQPSPPPPKTGWSAWVDKHRNHIVLGAVISALERRHIDADDLCAAIYGVSAPATDEQSQAIIEDLAVRWAQYAASYQSQSQEV